MKVIEAIISFLFLLIILSSIHIMIPYNDYSYLHYVLAEDVWRVLYLRNGDNMFFYFLGYNISNDINEIEDITSLCIDFGFEGMLSKCNNKGIIISHKILPFFPKYVLIMAPKS